MKALFGHQMMKGLVLLLAVVGYAFPANAFQDVAEKVEMADTMRSNGKIYVLVAIIVAILAGLLIYLWMLDRKISKLEQQVEDHR